MIFLPSRNIWTPEREWGQKKFQRGIICATAIHGSAEAPTVSLNTAGVSNLIFSATCFAGVQYASDGTEDASTNAGVFNVDRGNWLDSGPAAGAWVERTINSGSLDWQDPGSGRFQMSSTRQFGMMALEGELQTCNITVEMFDAASGGNSLDSVTYTLEAEGVPSDIRLKTGIRFITTLFDIRIYAWRWNGLARSLGVAGPTIGVIAQQVEYTHPKTVRTHSDGYKIVNYRKLGEA